MANVFSGGSSPVAAAALNLRPLSIGELLDRAFSLFFKNIIPLLSLLAVVIIPMAVLQYFMVKDLLGLEMNLITQAISHPTKTPDPSELNALNAAALRSQPLLALNYVFLLILLPLSNAAVVVGISHAYLGQQIRFKDCYAVALRRWFALLLLIFMWILTAAGVFLTGFFILLFVFAALAFVGAALKGLGAAIVIIAVIIAMCAFIGILIMGYMTFASSLVALMLEGVDPIRAFVLGFDRIFGGGLFWRSALMSLAISLLSIGFALVAAGIGALLAYLTKSPFLYVAIGGFANLVFLALAFVIVALYYYDVRIRREGFDLQVLTDQLARVGRPTVRT